RSILVFLPVHHEIVIMRRAFPKASRCAPAGLEVLPLDRLRWEINVALYSFVLICFGNHATIPNCLRHFFQPFFFGLGVMIDQVLLSTGMQLQNAQSGLSGFIIEESNSNL